MSTMGTPIVKGIPLEQIMAIQVKRAISNTVGSVASNALIDRYDLNPYVAMGIGIGISALTYRGIDLIEADTTLCITASDVKIVKEVSEDKAGSECWDMQDAIQNVKGVICKYAGTFIHETDSVKVVANSNGKVITVIPE